MACLGWPAFTGLGQGTAGVAGILGTRGTPATSETPREAGDASTPARDVGGAGHGC